MSRIYRHPRQPKVDVPQLDILTIQFESEHGVSKDDTIAHVDAAHPENKQTKAQLRESAEKIAHGLRHQYGIGANGPNKDVVTVITYNQMFIPSLFYGLLIAGGVYSAASPSSTVSELARQVDIGKSRLIVCGVEQKDVATEAAKRCNVPLDRVLILKSYPSWSLTSIEGNINAISTEKLTWKTITDPKTLKDSLAVILWSSGTTGLPKGVMISHANIVAELYLLTLSGRQLAVQEIERVGVDNFNPPAYRTLAHLPVSHIAGLLGYFLAPLWSGGTAYWMGKYNWFDLIKYARKYEITAFYTVPSIFLRISKSPDVQDAFKDVVAATTGAAPMDQQLQRSANTKLGDGKTIFIGQTWGLSETTGAITGPLADEDPDNTGAIGAILPGMEIRMVDEDFNDVEPGQEGELIVKGPVVTNGYFNNPQATKDSFHDGWFCSGDIAVQRNGKFYIVDRKKELLKYKGLQVAPAELENLLFTHPAIQEAAVVGVPAPDDPGTDWPRAYIVADESKVSADEVKQFVKDRVAQHKQLRGGVKFVNEIPKNAIGKFLRRELRERAKKEFKDDRAKL